MNDSSVTAEQLASYIQEDVAKVGKEAFGNIKLSLSEIKDLANKITFADMGDGITKFNEATESAKESLSSLERKTGKLVWVCSYPKRIWMITKHPLIIL